MHDKPWKSFFDDEMTTKALDDSEVFRSYAEQELRREAFTKSNENKINQIENRIAKEEEDLRLIEEFQKKVSSDPVLRSRLKMARNALEQNPELISKVDPNFVAGLDMLFLDEEDDYDI